MLEPTAAIHHTPPTAQLRLLLVVGVSFVFCFQFLLSVEGLLNPLDRHAANWAGNYRANNYGTIPISERVTDSNWRIKEIRGA